MKNGNTSTAFSGNPIYAKSNIDGGSLHAFVNHSLNWINTMNSGDYIQLGIATNVTQANSTTAGSTDTPFQISITKVL